MLKHTDNARKEILEAFKKYIMSTSDIDIKFEYTASMPIKKEDRVEILYTPTAYLKMRQLITKCATEIAWYGLIKRVNKHQFFVTDIIMYPQIVASATVEDDDNTIHQWFAKQPDDVVNAIRMQGHSHVNMATFASGTDAANRIKMMSGVSDFFIFQINNKANDDKYWVYDLETNKLYEPEDVIVDVTFKDKNAVCTLNTWYDETTKENIKKKQCTSTSNTTYGISTQAGVNTSTGNVWNLPDDTFKEVTKYNRLRGVIER